MYNRLYYELSKLNILCKNYKECSQGLSITTFSSRQQRTPTVDKPTIFDAMKYIFLNDGRLILCNNNLEENAITF